MLRFAVGIKARAPQVYSHPKKPPKMRYFGKMTPFRKNVEILFRKFSWRHRFSCSYFTEIVSRKVGETMCYVVLLTKSLQNTFYGAILAESAKSLQGRVSRNPTSPCKISSQSIPIWRNYSYRKWFRTITVHLTEYNSFCRMPA